jgi:transcriptional regulator with XRE-family HTH domain
MNEAEPARRPQSKKVGERIAEARVALKLQLEDIAERSRIPMRHLEAIEASNYEALPAAPYSAGFAKTFARMVGLDGEQIAADFRAERGDSLVQRSEYTPFEPADPSRVPPRLLAMIAFGTAVVLLIAYLAWRGGGAGEERQQLAAGTSPEIVANIAAPTVSAPAPRLAVPRAAPAVSPMASVVLTATDKVWIKVSESGGPTLFMGELAPGQKYVVPADAKDPRLLTGRPQMLRTQVGAHVIPVLGSGDKTISNVSLKGPALIEREAAMSAASAPRPPISADTPQTAPAVGAASNEHSPPSNTDQPSDNMATPATP